MLRRRQAARGALRSLSTGGAASPARRIESLAALRREVLARPPPADPSAGGGEASERVSVRGWVRSVRRQKRWAFVTVNDGQTQDGLQAVLPASALEAAAGLATGAAVELEGRVAAGAKGRGHELQGDSVRVIAPCAEDYPLQKKHHSLEFLRDVAHVRMRSNTLGAAMRVRSAAAAALHERLLAEDFLMVHTPVLTPLDCEGAGELFSVAPSREGGEHFFGRPAHLGVSGQLYGEMAAASLSRVYTFGPTFRAENSNTQRHVAEFWMLEPEVAHADLGDLLGLAERLVQHAAGRVLERCDDDMAFCDQRVRKGAAADARRYADEPFARMTYTEAVATLQGAGKRLGLPPPKWGDDLRSEHERFLAEEHCAAPVFVTDYPQALKPFYMKPSEDGGGAPGPTVGAFDLLVPHVGEVIGGSVREDRHAELEARMREHGLDTEGDYKWYLDLRRYGSVPHGGFGLGFDRFVQMLTGISNIRDVSAVPRTPGSISF